MTRFQSSPRRTFVAAAVLAMLAVLPASAMEQQSRPMTGAEFDAYTLGRTLTYGIGGIPYGIERYLPDRRVIWRFLGEECREGRWFEAGAEICFAYDDDPGRLHCWQFQQTPEGLRARIGSDPEGAELVEVEQSDRPMMCPGEFLGA